MSLNKKIINRKNCKECPWTNSDNHSLKWPSYVQKMSSINLIQNNQHRCHMIDNNVWCKPNTSNVCIGSLNNK